MFWALSEKTPSVPVGGAMGAIYVTKRRGLFALDRLAVLHACEGAV